LETTKGIEFTISGKANPFEFLGISALKNGLPKGNRTLSADDMILIEFVIRLGRKIA